MVAAIPSQTYHFRHSEHHEPTVRLARILAELRVGGSMAYDLWLPETNHLPYIVHEDEHIMGAVYGRYKGGRGVLVATNQRVIFLDKKPMFMHCDEITFAVIGGVTRSRIGLVNYVTLHTRLGDYRLRTFNQKAAENFVDYVEYKCLKDQPPFDGSLL